MSEPVKITKSKLIQLLDEVLSDDDSLFIEFQDESDVRYIMKTGDLFPNKKLIQSDDIIKITAAWGLKWWNKHG